MHETAKKVDPALWLPWLPIDSDPVPEIFLECLNGAYLPLTYSKWGHQLLKDAGVLNHYIPHGIEPSVYKVLPDRGKVLDFKRALTGMEHSHLSAIVAANKGFPDRKWFQGQLEAWRDFAIPDKPDARLYIHTDPTQAHGGVDFPALCRRLGLQDRIIVPNRYKYRMGYPAGFLNMVYNAADVLLSVSMSEGFGIPIIEAQAAGTPVIVTNFSAMPELVRWGEIVNVADRVLMPAHSYQAWPSKADMTDKLNKLYDEWLADGSDWPMPKRLAAQDAIHAEYSWDIIVKDQWAPLFARVAEDAPELDGRFKTPGVETPKQDVEGFIGVLRQELKKDAPKRRIAPLVKEPAIQEVIDLANVAYGNGNGADIHTAYETLSDEEVPF